jgi:hypothetical protein
VNTAFKSIIWAKQQQDYYLTVQRAALRLEHDDTCLITAVMMNRSDPRKNHLAPPDRYGLDLTQDLMGIQKGTESKLGQRRGFRQEQLQAAAQLQNGDPPQLP